MAEIINLRQVRKSKRRAAAERDAASNRVAFGRTKVERELRSGERVLAERHLDGHRRSDPS